MRRALVLLLVLSAVLAPLPAQAQEAATSSITGRVTDARGAAVAGACVRGYQGSFAPEAETRTAADGTYRLDGLRAGVAQVLLDVCETASDIAPQWWKGAVRERDARGVELTAGQTTPFVDLTAVPGSALSGRVTDTTGAPVVGACVQALGVESNGYRFAFRSARTAPDGGYRIDRLPAHPVTVQFLDCGAGEFAVTYAPATSDPAQARVVTPPEAGELGGVDVQVSRPARLSGTVRDEAGPLAGACVQLTSADGSRSLDRSSTGADGRYAFRGVAPGRVRVRVEDCATGLHLTRTHDAEGWTGSPDGGLLVASGEDRLLPDVVLPPGGAVSGSVVDGTGAPVLPGCATARPGGTQAQPLGEPVTRFASGRFLVGALPPGRYAVAVGTCAGGDYGLVWAGGDDRPTTAVLVDVAPGRATEVAVRRPAVARASGTVRDETGRGVRACVLLDDEQHSTSQADGTWTSQPLYPRTHVVSFATRCEPGEFGSGARSLELAPGEARTGVDGTVALAVGLSGHVRDRTGAPVRACVSATGATTGARGSTQSDAAGAWRLDGLPPDAYTVLLEVCRVDGPNLAPTYHPGVPALSEAVPVPLGTTAVTGIDTVMLPGRQVSGVITGPDGAPYEGACVRLRRPFASTPVTATGGRTDADGRYVVGALAPGSYQVQAERCPFVEAPGEPAPTWWPASARRSGAQPLVVGAADRTGVDVRLLAGGTWSGRVVDTAGAPVQACVLLFTDEEGWQRSVRTAEDGRWSVSGVGTSGDAELRFDDCGRGERVTLRVRPLTTTAGTVVQRPDAVLRRAGSISGTVRDVSGRPLRGLCVVSDETGAVASTAADGSYRLRGLPPGATLVRFTDCGSSADLVVPEHWRDAATAATATPVEVREGADTGGIDAELLVVSVPGLVRDVRAALGADRALVTWTAPESDGGSSVTSYVVRAAPRGDVVAVVSGAARTAVVTGLAGAGRFSFTVEAVNRKGEGPASSATPELPLLLPSRLTLSGPASVPAGGSAVLVAALGRPGRTVRLGSLSAVTDSTGVARFTVRPARTTRFTASFGGDATHAPVTAVREVRVVPRLSARLDAPTVPLGALAVVTGGAAGLPAGHRVVLQLRRGDGSWANVGTGYLTSGRAVRLTYRAPRRGTSVLRLVAPLAGGYPVTTSAVLSVRTT